MSQNKVSDMLTYKQKKVLKVITTAAPTCRKQTGFDVEFCHNMEPQVVSAMGTYVLKYPATVQSKQ